MTTNDVASPRFGHGDTKEVLAAVEDSCTEQTG